METDNASPLPQDVFNLLTRLNLKPTALLTDQGMLDPSTLGPELAGIIYELGTAIPPRRIPDDEIIRLRSLVPPEAYQGHYQPSPPWTGRNHKHLQRHGGNTEFLKTGYRRNARKGKDNGKYRGLGRYSDRKPVK